MTPHNRLATSSTWFFAAFFGVGLPSNKSIT
jgi:hypothetical protein